MAASFLSGDAAGSADWPALPYGEWKDTRATLHMWCQIVGKIRLAQSPRINHSWHATFYPTARGIANSNARLNKQHRRGIRDVLAVRPFLSDIMMPIVRIQLELAAGLEQPERRGSVRSSRTARWCRR